ncbi:DUF11 domain-containing protein [Frankia sp. AgB32]|uniref:DUF11 domain-containing protein n=1 Tax=Frankia sp. AgB32 TaxID=631119 RepID=UPI00200BEE03|nr:DUF11 domain-containing protein [Frankia sp. AgB32]MCK9894812.1 DUF11 domain-containing protein [Frankia sp. AgB32]
MCVAVGGAADAATPVVRAGALKLITKRAATGVQGATFGWNYTAPNKGAVPGTINIDVPAGFSAPQTGAPAGAGYLSATTTCAQFQITGTAAQADGSTMVTIASNCSAGNTAVITYGNVTGPETPGSYVFAASFTPVGAAPIPFAAADTITIKVGPLASLSLSPASATIAPGASQAYTVTGFDAFGNALGSTLAGTNYKIIPDGRCTRAVCTATKPGAHTVTATARGISATATLTVSGSTTDSADLAVTQSVSTTTPTYYTNVTFSTTVTNTSDVTASAGVAVHVAVPAGLVSPQVTPSGSTAFDQSSGTWTVGGLAPTASATLTISGLAGDVALGAQTVTATATSTTDDPNPASNTASVDETSQPAPVAVVITPGPGNPSVIDISSAGTASWTASFVNAANQAAPAPVGGYFWACDTASGNPCPPVPALVHSPDTPPVITFTTSDLQIDSYTLSAIFVPRESAENKANYVQEQVSSTVSFVTTNSGGN